MRSLASRWVIAIGCVAALASCSGVPRLASAPTAAVSLSGHWILDGAASDDATAMVRAVLPHPKEVRQPRYDGWGNEVSDGSNSGGPSQSGGRGGGRQGGGSRSGRNGAETGGPSAFSGREASPVWGRNKPYDFLTYFAVPETRLNIQQQSTVFRIGSGERLRAFVPGDEDPINLTDRFGARALRGGWMADAFVVSIDDGKNLHVIDSIRSSRDGALERIVEVKVTGIKTLTVHSRYRRATEAEWANLGDEGPPAPGR